MEDCYPSLPSGETLEMECEETGEEESQDKDEEVIMMKSRWPEQEAHLVSCFAKHLVDKMTELIKKNCYGCQNDHPSQIQHDKCLMLSQEEKLDEYLDEAWSLISNKDVLHQWYKDLREHSCPPLTTQEIHRIEALLNQSEETERITVYSSDIFKQKVRIELTTYYYL